MIIPYQELSKDALDGICREYILQQLDSQFDPDFDMALAVQQVFNRVRKGELVVNYSEVSESVTLTPLEELQALGYQGEEEE